VLHKRPIAPAHGGAPYARVRPTPDEQVLPLAQSPLRGVSFNDAFYCAIADASASRYHRAVLDGVLRGTSINTLRQRPEVLGAFGIAPQEALSKSELKRRLVQQLVLQMRQEVAERLLSPRHRPVLDGMIQFALRHARLVTPA